MQLTEGSVLIHPHHGPCTVSGITSRELRGSRTDYAQLIVHQMPMTIMIPVERADDVGIRTVADGAALDRLAAILTAPTGSEERSWSRRIKAYRDEVNSGDPRRIARVLRDLLRRLETKGHMSQAEKDLLKQAAAPLVAEVVVAVSCSEEQARAVVRRLVLEASRDVLVELADVA